MFKEDEPKQEDFFITKYRKLSDNTTKAYEHFREQEYKNALKKWNQYLEWKRKRNPERAKLEEKYGYDCKHAMHLVRLLRMGVEILSEGKVEVLRSDREELLKIRRGEWEYDRLVEYAENLEGQLDELYEKSPLRKAPDIKKIDKLLIEITEEFLNENGK